MLGWWVVFLPLFWYTPAWCLRYLRLSLTFFCCSVKNMGRLSKETRRARGGYRMSKKGVWVFRLSTNNATDWHYSVYDCLSLFMKFWGPDNCKGIGGKYSPCMWLDRKEPSIAYYMQKGGEGVQIACTIVYVLNGRALTKLVQVKRTLKGNCGTSLPGQGIKSSFFWGHQWKQWKSDKRFKSCSQNKYLPCCPVGAAILFILPRVQHSNVVSV